MYLLPQLSPQKLGTDQAITNDLLLNLQKMFTISFLTFFDTFLIPLNTY